MVAITCTVEGARLIGVGSAINAPMSCTMRSTLRTCSRDALAYSFSLEEDGF